MTRKSKPISWRQESGIENVEWIALAAVLLVTLVVAGTTIEVGGQTVGARLVTQISCWVAGWQGEGSAACGAATAGGAGAGAAGVGAATGQPSTVAGLPQGSSLTDERGSMLTFLTTRSESALRSVGIGAEDRSSYVDLGASDALMGVYANSYDNPLVQDSAEMLGWRYNVYTGEFEKTDQPQEDLDPLEEMSRLADLCVAGTVPPQNCEFLFTGVFDP